MNLKQSFVKKPGHVRALSVHLLRTDQNEHVAVLDHRGVTPRRELSHTLQSMFRTRETTSSERGLFQVSINPEADRAATMTPEEWAQCFDAVEREFNLAEQPRVLVEHVKDGRRHVHALYQTADVERGRQVDDFAHNYRRGAKVARDLERELGHTVQPERSTRGGSYTQGQNERAGRESGSLEEWRKDVRAAWKQTTTAEAFRVALRAKGYDVAEGNGGRVCFISPDGQPSALGGMLKGIASAKDARDRFDGHQLDSVEITAARQRARQTAEVEPVAPEMEEAPPLPDRDEVDDAQDRAAALIDTFRKREARREHAENAADLLAPIPIPMKADDLKLVEEARRRLEAEEQDAADLVKQYERETAAAALDYTIQGMDEAEAWKRARIEFGDRLWERKAAANQNERPAPTQPERDPVADQEPPHQEDHDEERQRFDEVARMFSATADDIAEADELRERQGLKRRGLDRDDDEQELRHDRL